MPITFGCKLPSRGNMASPENLTSLALRAEDLGFDSVWVSDHIILPREVESFYPYASDGVATFTPDEPYYEPISTLNFLAGATNSIRLGTHVLIVPYRNPVLTAKMLSTLDVLSNGRLVVGAGVGWMREEFEALGLDYFTQRGAVTDEYLEIFNELWTNKTPMYDGNFFSIDGGGFLPKPIQKPRPPLWIGGHSKPALRRAAQYGDGWMPIGLRPPAILEPTELYEKIESLKELTVAYGRPEDSVTPCFSTHIALTNKPPKSRTLMQGIPEQIAADIRQYQDSGVKNFIFDFAVTTLADQLEAMEKFSREVITLIPHR